MNYCQMITIYIFKKLINEIVWNEEFDIKHDKANSSKITRIAPGEAPLTFVYIPKFNIVNTNITLEQLSRYVQERKWWFFQPSIDLN